jgi:hypothetical protein
MEQLAPLLVRAFGERWLERGSISLYFLTPTLHGEEVRASIGVPRRAAGGRERRAGRGVMERRDGTHL